MQGSAQRNDSSHKKEREPPKSVLGPIDAIDSSMACTKLDPYYDMQKKSIELVKEFIKARKLVLYGGTALDYAARLAGGSIYDDSKLDLPDLDFYSRDPVTDTRDLAEIVFNAGFEEARSIGAIHVGTMRVDPGGNHFIADISYCPMIDELDTLIYDGMLIVHPIYQRMDMHSSLSFPYDNAPREVIFDRWKKDIERFGIIDKLYPDIWTMGETTSPPIPPSFNKMRETKSSDYKPGTPIAIPNELMNQVLTGSTAWSIIDPSWIHSDIFEIVSMNPMNTIEELGAKLISSHRRYFSFLPELYFIELKGKQKVVIHSTENRLVSIISATMKHENSKEHKVRLTCGNYIAKTAIGWIKAKRDIYPFTPNKNMLQVLYDSIMNTDIDLSINVYGDENIDNTEMLRLEEQAIRLGHRESGTQWPLPGNYNVRKGHRPPDYDYESNTMFMMDARKLL